MIALFAFNEFIFKFSHFQSLEDKLFDLIFFHQMKICLSERIPAVYLSQNQGTEATCSVLFIFYKYGSMTVRPGKGRLSFNSDWKKMLEIQDWFLESQPKGCPGSFRAQAG